MQTVTKMIVKLKIDLKRLVILLEYFFIRKKPTKKDDGFFDNTYDNGNSEN